MDNKNEILIYEDKDGLTKVNVTFTLVIPSLSS